MLSGRLKNLSGRLKTFPADLKTFPADLKETPAKLDFFINRHSEGSEEYFIKQSIKNLPLHCVQGQNDEFCKSFI